MLIFHVQSERLYGAVCECAVGDNLRHCGGDKVWGRCSCRRAVACGVHVCRVDWNAGPGAVVGGFCGPACASCTTQQIPVTSTCIANHYPRPYEHALQDMLNYVRSSGAR